MDDPARTAIVQAHVDALRSEAAQARLAAAASAAHRGRPAPTAHHVARDPRDPRPADRPGTTLRASTTSGEPA
jgi:hypothetical protein